MAATFSQLTKIAQDGGFQQRVRIAALLTALNVYNEVSTTPGHGTRATFATKVLTNQGPDAFTLALAVLTASGNISLNANLNTLPDFGILDSDIENQLSAMWNAMAGV